LNDHLRALREAGFRVTVHHDTVRKWSIFCYKGRQLEYWCQGSAEDRALAKARDALLGADAIPHMNISPETREWCERVKRAAHQALREMGYRR
jgi:hypothetical protein